MEDMDSGQPKAKKKKTEREMINGGGTRKIQVLKILTFVGEESNSNLAKTLFADYSFGG